MSTKWLMFFFRFVCTFIFRLFPKVIYLIQSNAAVYFVEFQATTHLFTKCIELHAYTRFIVYSTEIRCNDCVRQLLVLHTFLFFRRFFFFRLLLLLLHYTGINALDANCMERYSSKRRHAYAHVHIIKYSFIAHRCCCCSLLFVILLKFSRLYIVINMHRIHKRDCCCWCCSENEMPRKIVNIQLPIEFDLFALFFFLRMAFTIEPI